MSSLYKFAEKKGAGGIEADRLDANFARLKPLMQDGNAPQYSVTQTPEGWSLNIFPPFPAGTGPFVLAYSGGALIWLETEACT